MKNFEDFRKGLLEIMGADFKSKPDYTEAGLSLIDDAPGDMQEKLLELFIVEHRMVPPSKVKIRESRLNDERWKMWANNRLFVETCNDFCSTMWKQNVQPSEMAGLVWARLKMLKGDGRLMFLTLALFDTADPLANYTHIKDKLTAEEFDKLKEDEDMKLRLMEVHRIVTHPALRWTDAAAAILELIGNEPDPKKKAFLLSAALIYCTKTQKGLTGIIMAGMGNSPGMGMLSEILSAHSAEDCEKCEELPTCPMPGAVDARKELGIKTDRY